MLEKKKKKIDLLNWKDRLLCVRYCAWPLEDTQMIKPEGPFANTTEYCVGTLNSDVS